MVNSEISHEDFTTITNEKENSRELKDIRMMKTQKSDTERNNLIEEGKIKGINKIISQNA